MNDLQARLRLLRSVEHRITADPAWVQATRSKLLMQAKNSLPSTKLGFFARQREMWRAFGAGKASQFVRKPVMTALSLLAIALGGSILSVSAAQHSLPGDFFYGLKLVTEQAQLALTSGAEDKLELKTQFTEQRVSEFQQIVSSDPQQVSQVTEILKSDLNTIKQQLKDVPASGAVAAAKLVDQKTNDVISALQATKSQLTPDSKAQVTDVQSVAADTGISAIAVLAQQNQQSSSTVPALDVAQAIQSHVIAVDNATGDALSTTGTSSVASSTATLLDVASSTAEMSSSTLPGIVNQVKDLTDQAFAAQKAQDQLEVTASTLNAAATSSTDDGTTNASASGTDASTTLDVLPPGSNTSASSSASSSNPLSGGGSAASSSSSSTPPG
ncbi:MAG: DUF5667 domain-containing protein [Patescibacteria group bacterium]